MVDPDIVAYLKANLKKFPADTLRKQLADEGISHDDIEESLAAALRKPAPLAPPPPPSPSKRKAGFIFACAAFGGIVGLAVFSLNDSTPKEKAVGPPSAPMLSPGETGESAYMGRLGFVVRLPQSYVAVPSDKRAAGDHEIVHFCKDGTDPTNFTDEGLFGQLGIVRLEVHPDVNAGTLQGLGSLQNRILGAASARKEKFSAKNFDVGSLHAFSVTYEAPYPRLETYMLGKKVSYSFLAGQDDQTYRDIVMSLRETSSEN